MQLTTMPPTIATAVPDGGDVPALDRHLPGAADRVARRARQLAAAWPAPPDAPPRERWPLLAAAGREDLCVGRLVEGHVDAVGVLAEAGREPDPGALYGVWASASGGTGLAVRAGDGAGVLLVDGTMRYCSGAGVLDRALVVADGGDRANGGRLLLDLDLHRPGLRRDDTSWPAVGMDATRSVDVTADAVGVDPGDVVGPPGFYLDRPGFAAGGVGVAAVWLGGAFGVLDGLVRQLRGRDATPHQRAHLGTMAVALAAADALLAELAGAHPASIRATDAGAARSAVEAAVDTVLRLAPRVSGPTPLCRDGAFAHRMADLQVYVRQHHAEADLERLGAHLLATGTLLGRAVR